MLYSFDVFDTLITRKTATPRGIFALMQKSLFSNEKYSIIDSWVKSNFFDLRINAEKLAWKMFATNGETEITLDEIYETLSKSADLSSEQSELIKELEIETELENVVPIKENIERVISLHENNNQVVLISDMYLSEETIKKMLIKADERLAQIPLYVSSKYRKNKGSKQLYEVANKNCNATYSEWIHHGDSEHSDVDAPSALGIITEKIDSLFVLPIEKYAIENNEDNAYFQNVIGAGINARLESKTKSVAYNYGTSIIVPVLYGYARWIIKWAQNNRIVDLYFIARDGYVIKKVVDSILKKTDISIRTHYIYGSRRAWRLVSFSEDNWDLQEFFRWSGSVNDMTFAYLAKCFEIDSDTLITFLKNDFLPEEHITYTQRQKIIDTLQENDDFKHFIIKEQSEKRKYVLEYLKREIDINSNSYAFVDFVGSGYTQKCLSRILLQETNYPTKSLFYRLDANISDEHCELFAYNAATIKKDIVEALLFAPHGSTIGYSKKSDEVSPILDEENKALESYGLNEFIRGLCESVDRIDYSLESSIKLEKIYIDYIENKADIDLANFIGDIPFSKSVKEGLLTYAPKLSDEDIKNLFLIRTSEPLNMFYQGLDLDCSIKRCSDIQLHNIDEYKNHYSSKDAHKQRIEYWKQSPVKWEKILGYEEIFNHLGQQIVVYGAGKKGKQIVDILLASVDREIVAWIDKNYDHIKDTLIQVESIDSVIGKNYDNIIIAVVDKTIQAEIQRDLLDLGVDKERIYCI